MQECHKGFKLAGTKIGTPLPSNPEQIYNIRCQYQYQFEMIKKMVSNVV